MRLSCAPGGILVIERPGQGVSDMKRAGFTETVCDFSLCCFPRALENYGKKAVHHKPSERVLEAPEALGEVARPMLDKCREQGLALSLGIAPYLCRDTKRQDQNGLLLTLARESIRVCGQAGCEYLVVRPLFAGIDPHRAWETNKEFYLNLAETAREQQVMILLENQCRDLNGHLVRGLMADGVTAADWVDRLNEAVGEERFGFCMNINVCNICGQNMYDFAVMLGNRMKAVILSESDGSWEDRLLPFTVARGGLSQMDWLNLFRGLRTIGFDGILAVDFTDTAASVSPILRPALMRLAKETADYFKWQIELEQLLQKYPQRVLFGAGNMCRNYMKCYGQQYPPLYTCDNDSKKWGTEFEGLLIKNPESLRELPETTAIFICNVYYREIEAQLREMGLNNPIEFFNDEYLASFHFDRVEDLEEKERENKEGGAE